MNIKIKDSKNIFIILLIIVTLIHFILILNSSYIGHADCASNAVIAKNIIKGEGFKNDAVHYFFIKYPSLPRPEDTWPLLQPVFIAMSYLLFGISAVSAKIPNLIFFVLLCLLTYHIALKLFNRKVAFITGLFMLFNPYYLFSYYILYPYNDFGFALFLLGSCYFFHRAISNRGKDKKEFYKSLLITSLIISLAIFQKQPGILLPIIMAGYLLVVGFRDYIKNKEKIRLASTVKEIIILTIPPFISFAVLKIREYFIKDSSGAYPYVVYLVRFIDYVNTPNKIYFNNPPNIAQSFLNLQLYLKTAIHETGLWLINPLSILFPILFLVHWLYFRQKKIQNTFFNISFIFFILYSGAMLFVYHYEYRHFTIYLPYIFMLGSYIGVELYGLIVKKMSSAKKTNKRILKKGLQITVILFVLIYVIVTLHVSYPRVDRYFEKDSVIQLHGFVDKNLPKDAVIMSRNEFALSFYSNREVVGFPLLDYNQLVDLIEYYKITHIITSPKYKEFYEDERILNLIDGKEIPGFEKMHEMENVYSGSIVSGNSESKNEVFIYKVQIDGSNSQNIGGLMI